MAEATDEITRDVLAVGRIDAVPTILQILCDTTGMGFAAVARVSGESWTACAVKDDIRFGLTPGGQLDLKTTLCYESRAARQPITIDHASIDPRYRGHHTPRLYHIESYISVPIVLSNNEYFGNLCAIDPRPARVSEPRVLAMFEGFARLIALQLDRELVRDQEKKSLIDERAAGELRERFIAILGHDLRNPLQSIVAVGDVLERKYASTPDISGLGEQIKRSASRMSKLIDDVLDFARARLGGGLGMDIREVTDIETALTGVVQELQVAKPDRPIVLDLGVMKAIDCDVARVQQLASNLIGNALAHGSPANPVKVSAHAVEGELVLEVWNDGEPIPPDDTHKVFDPFWQQAQSGHRQGLGLGLHICEQIVRGHAGTISVKSSREQGTQFTARLPLNRSRSPQT